MIPSSGTATGSGKVVRLAGIRRTVTDLTRAIDFYCGALGFACDRTEPCDPIGDAFMRADEPMRCARLTLGDEAIELVAPVGFERRPGLEQMDAGVSAIAFQHIAIVTRDMAAALARLRRFSPNAISSDGAVRLPDDAGGVTAFKFRGPDRHPIELIVFPEGSGDPKWQQRQEGAPYGITLGIDHSAIAVGDVERSIAFYVEQLGFRVGSRHLNRGREQARLDGTPESEVEVVALTPSARATPHLELLAYRTPPPQGERRIGSLVNDRSDRLTLIVDNLRAIKPQLDALQAEPSALPGTRAVIGEAGALLRDPDGHLLLLQQQSGNEGKDAGKG